MSSPPASRPTGERASTLTTRIRTGWRRQLLLFLAAYGAYNLARWVFAGDPSTAVRHAHGILRLERGMGVAIEASVQHALDSGVPAWVLSNVYLAAQLVVPPAAFIWLYRRSPRVYRGLRDTVLATWLIAIPIYALFPVAPPRLAEPGIVDTVSAQVGVGLTGRSTIFYNPLAAVPSLHVGFAAAIGIALFLALRSRWAKALALLWGPTVALAVVATGNHYLFDIVAGLLVTVAGFGAARLIGRLGPSPRRGGEGDRHFAVLVGQREARDPGCLREGEAHGRPAQA
jgi:membrane-associated phospholipid phosphatase